MSEQLNPPRAFNLEEPSEMLRLYRECFGYLHTCHYKHGTDWEGRKFAIEALEKLSAFPPSPTKEQPR